MKLFELVRTSFAALMLSFMAIGMFAGCSSSEEAPPAEASGGGYEECLAACAEGDVQCKDECATNL